MDLFITKVRLNDKITKEQVWKLICDWLLNSPHYNIKSISNYTFKNDFSQRFDNSKLDAINLTINDELIFACRFINYEQTNTWISDIIFTDKKSRKDLSIRLSCENVEYSATLPYNHKPYIIKLLFDNDFCYKQDYFAISDTPILLNTDDIELCANIMIRQQSMELPIVYISFDTHNHKHYSVDPNVAAQKLSGIAHVLVEPNREFSLALKERSQSKNAYNGYIGVYFPNTDYREIVAIDDFIIDGNINSKLMLAEIERVVKQSLINHTNATDWTWSLLQLEYHKLRFAEQQQIIKKENKDLQETLSQANSTEVDLRAAIETLKNQLKNKDYELETFIQEFDNENKNLKEKNNSLRSQLDSKSAQLESLKQKNNSDVLLLAKSDLQDFFADEIKDCVMNILNQVKDKYLDGIGTSRTYDIIQNLVNSNPLSNHGKAIYREIESALNEKSLPARRKKLEICGFTISVGSHDKMYFHDPKFSTTLANSGSDYHGNDNQYHDIKKQIDIYNKLF